MLPMRTIVTLAAQTAVWPWARLPRQGSGRRARHVLDLYEELRALVARLEERELEYALCGGLAMAVYGTPRATVDIDLLMPGESLPEAVQVARQLGYTIEAAPRAFAEGAIRIRRLSKIDPESKDVLTLDLLLVTPEIAQVWQGRRQVGWAAGKLSVVSREGLIALKVLRGSGQDLDDINRLTEGHDED